MPRIHLETCIAASMDVCFDLNRDIDVHMQTAAGTGERAISGVTSGLIGMGQEVTWEAIHLGVSWRLTSRVTLYEPPHLFVDEQARGPFKSFHHRHEFREADGGTLMIDDFAYVSPCGALGVVADKLLLERYMRDVLSKRAAFIKGLAKSRPGPH